MTNSYLAVVSAYGLELIVPETAHARHFLMRRCFGVRQGSEACFWVCLPPENIKLIRWLTICDQRRPALWLLNQAALESGPISPTWDHDSVGPEFFFAHQEHTSDPFLHKSSKVCGCVCNLNGSLNNLAMVDATLSRLTLATLLLDHLLTRAAHGGGGGVMIQVFWCDLRMNPDVSRSPRCDISPAAGAGSNRELNQLSVRPRAGCVFPFFNPWRECDDENYP